ncbi:GTP binding protein, putative [Trypanosoma brucei gambiense DAL972]|uniref:GTP binding protein, putative n=1 Tax=Trypanosoma brucei gambiense (strain MHOM/CI/86/DAL972) TaxID=679716 RepID=C9ZJD5_TRYB9|nr:GTP binding protein, putative [Trypanosoma brucei gambiense DAL972]CBH09494.1 GTP binding protein, putative [Trypanosoma brucei gambiense DAL972]|eukprot:XP_011771799.1 GTP binding protein, putative [Trypanosoma brucei gambiense DAL972]
MHTSSLRLRRRGAGIIGLPNVGKSTLFNALTCNQQAKTGNFPFCTIDANLARVPVADDRLRRLATFSGAHKIVDVEIDLADVAGLIEGASKGAGLGNKFLSDIRPCTILLHMVRCFESARDGFGTPTPLEDVCTIVNELVLADLEAMEKILSKQAKIRKVGDPSLVICQRVVSWLQEGKPAADMSLKTDEERQILQQYNLLSAKPMMFVLNTDESTIASGNRYTHMVESALGSERTCRVCASLEEQTSQLNSREERLLFLKEYGVDTPHGELLLRRAYKLLRLQSFFTIGPQMAHGWTTRVGASAKEASGEIHSDMEQHFHRAKIMPWDKFIEQPNLEAAELKMAYVDATYTMQDGDIMIVEHGASR